jgi:thioredoxin 1
MHGVRISAAVMVGIIATLLVLDGCTREKAEQQVGKGTRFTTGQPDTSRTATVDADGEHGGGSRRQRLPRLVDLGKGTCIPCKKMAPILEELRKEYEGRAAVDVIDLRDDPGAAGEYGIRLIPTQIFFDDEGNEVWRHEGFLAKQTIIDKLTEMGVEPFDN